MKLGARVEGIGLVGPGFASWAAAREALAGRVPYARTSTTVPAPQALPPTERRRAVPSVRLALAAGLEAVASAKREAAALAAVFASSSGDGENCHAICEVLASDDRQISPTRFHNSVHNAPAGYWSIATGATASVDSVAAFDASFGAGLLEALGHLAADPATPVVLVAYDAPYPEPLHATRPVPDALAVAMVLSSAADGAGPRIEAGLALGSAQPMHDAELERLRRDIPAARALPLLEILARGERAAAALEYLDGLVLRVEVRP
ncbi:MAG TPA: beta-ketoacyl synthase chain length factor [Usitatibacter sp.]|nr:beta-ketoacyl synthase chain length factor [Usitatibacter sp.]